MRGGMEAVYDNMVKATGFLMCAPARPAEAPCSQRVVERSDRDHPRSHRLLTNRMSTRRKGPGTCGLTTRGGRQARRSSIAGLLKNAA